MVGVILKTVCKTRLDADSLLFASPRVVLKAQICLLSPSSEVLGRLSVCAH